MEQKYIVAFEIGSSSIKGTVAAATDDSGHINVLAVAEEPIRDKVRYGLVENPGEVASIISNLIRRLQQTRGVAPRLIRSAYVGISGRSVTSIPCTVSRDFHAELEVTDSVVDDILNEAVATPIGDKSVVRVLPVSFSIDGRAVTEPVGEFGHSISAKVNLITCKPKMKNNLNRVFHERCGINIAGYIVTPVAVANQVLTPEERRLGVMFVDFGAETTSIVIYRQGVLQYLSTIPIGSRNITRDLTSLNFLEERAEEIKKAVGDAMPQVTPSAALTTDGVDNTDINNIVAARADEIVSNIIEHINYAELRREQLPAGIVLTGGGARLRNFIELLGKLSKMKTRMASVSSSVTLSTHDFPADRILDVTAIASAAAAADSVTECTEMPQDLIDRTPAADVDDYDPFTRQAQAAAQANRPAATTQESSYQRPAPKPDPFDDRNDISRIGTYDEDDLGDLDDEFDDEEESGSRRSIFKKGKNKDKNKETKKQRDKNESHEGGFWAKLGNKVTRMMQEDDDDE